MRGDYYVVTPNPGCTPTRAQDLLHYTRACGPDHTQSKDCAGYDTRLRAHFKGFYNQIWCNKSYVLSNYLFLRKKVYFWCEEGVRLQEIHGRSVRPPFRSRIVVVNLRGHSRVNAERLGGFHNRNEIEVYHCPLA